LETLFRSKQVETFSILGIGYLAGKVDTRLRILAPREFGNMRRLIIVDIGAIASVLEKADKGWNEEIIAEWARLPVKPDEKLR
jgi:hypothetical protein